MPYIFVNGLLKCARITDDGVTDVSLLLLLLMSMHKALCVDYCTMQAVILLSIIFCVLSVVSSEVKF